MDTEGTQRDLSMGTSVDHGSSSIEIEGTQNNQSMNTSPEWNSSSKEVGQQARNSEIFEILGLDPTEVSTRFTEIWGIWMLEIGCCIWQFSPSSP
jgi:hypothetical protein